MSSFKSITNKLKKKKITVSVVESCTGGLLSYSFTQIPGISSIFEMGLVTYSNNAKNTILNINKNMIKKNGAVSKEIAREMVFSLSKISKSKLCISITGIAGPNGGSQSKPVGLIFIGIKLIRKIYIIEKKFTGTRKQIQQKTVNYIFNYINNLI